VPPAEWESIGSRSGEKNLPLQRSEKS
jgi:hypothetical protein